MNYQNDTDLLEALLLESDHPVIPAVNPRTGEQLWVLERPLLLRSGLHITLDGAHLRLQDGVFCNIFTTEWEIGSGTDPLHDIHIVGNNGAILDGGNPNGLTENTMHLPGMPVIHVNHLIFMRGVDGFSLKNLHFMNPRHWCMSLYGCSNGVMSDLRFTAANNVPNQDGIDLRAGCHHIDIRHITGTTGDDTIALTALGGDFDRALFFPCAEESIHDVTISDVRTYVTGGHGIVRLLTHDGLTLYNVIIEHIHDCSEELGGVRCIAAVRIGDKRYWQVRKAVDADMYNISVRDVVTNANNAVLLYGNPEGFVMEDIVNTAGELFKQVIE